MLADREDVNEWRLQKKNKTLSFMQQQPGFRRSDSLFLETWSGSFASSALSCEREADMLRMREEGGGRVRHGAHEDFTFALLHVQFESFRVGFQCNLVLWLKSDAVNVEQSLT